MTAPITATGPFLDFGFTKVDLKPKSETKHFEFTITGRQRGEVDQWLQGEIDLEGRGVIIGTIDLVPRVPNPYEGYHEVGPAKRQIPVAAALSEWNRLVGKGHERWNGIVSAKPKDVDVPQALAQADRQNELIYAVVLLANEALKMGVGPKNPLRYVAHQHVSSVDGGIMMAYGRATRGWETQDMTYVMTKQPTDPLAALLGNTNASFVQFLIEQFGHRLGISRLESITVSRTGLDVRWNFA